MKRTYYIFRHGETFVTQSQRKIQLYGLRHFSAHILPEGIPALKGIGHFLKDKPVDYFVSSKYLRCKETAAIISEITKDKFTFDSHLNDYFIETFWHFRKRLQKFLNNIESSNHKTIAICTHGVVITGLVNLLTKNKFTFSEMFHYPSPGELIVIEGGNVKTINFNQEE